MILFHSIVTLWLVTCVLGRTAPDYRAHDLKRIVHLRDKVDRLQLQQKTDRMKLEVLQKSVEELLANQLRQSSQNVLRDRAESGQNVPREPKSPHSFTQGAALSDVSVTEDIGVLSKSEKTEMEEKTVNEKLGIEENTGQSDDVRDHSLRDELRQDVMNLRKEVSDLKSSQARLEAMCQREQETQTKPPPSVPNFTFHSSSEASRSQPTGGTYTSSSDENRHKEILWIEENWKRLQNLQEDLEHKCNVTVAMHVQQEVESRLSGLDESVLVLQDSLSRTSARVAVADGQLSALSQEEQETKQSLQKANSKLADIHNEVASLREDFNEVLFTLPDGALSSGFFSENSANSSGSSARSSISKLQRSSVELLEALDSLQSRHEKDQTRVGQELAELEYNVSRATQELHEAIKLLQSNSAREAHHEVDMNSLTDHFKMLKDSFSLLSLYQNDIAYRLGKLENARLTIPTVNEPMSGTDVSLHSSDQTFDGVVSLLSPGRKSLARTKLRSKMKHRRRKNKREYKFRT